MFLLSLLTNKDSYNTQIIQCVNDTIFRKRFRVPGFGTGSRSLEPVGFYVKSLLITIILKFDNIVNVF